MSLSAQEYAAKYLKDPVIHDLGQNLAVITFHDEDLEKLAMGVLKSMEGDSNFLAYDAVVNLPFGKGKGKRHRGEGFFFLKDKCPVNAYKFGGSSLVGKPMNDSMQAMIGYINAKYFKEHPFCAMLVNHYPNYKAYIGPHSDSDVKDDQDGGVFAFSIGQPRDLIFRESDDVRRQRESLKTPKAVEESTGKRKRTNVKEDFSGVKINPIKVKMEHGQSLIMYGKKFQKMVMHGINKGVVGPKNYPQKDGVEGRYSFTFRRHAK